MIKNEILEKWAKDQGIVLNYNDYLGYERFIILTELKRINIEIDFSNINVEKMTSEEFALAISKRIMEVFNIDEDDVGIFGKLKRDIERAKKTREKR